MKRIKTGMFMLYAVFGIQSILSAQIGSEVAKTLKNQKALKLAQEVKDLNQNVVANMRLKDEGSRHNCPAVNNVCKVSTKIIHTGRKDPNGNEIIYVNFLDEKLKGSGFILKPDFEDYPMSYVCFNLNEEEVRYTKRAERPGKSYLSRTNMVLANNSGGSFFAAEQTQSNADDRFFVPNKKDGDMDADVLKLYTEMPDAYNSKSERVKSNYKLMSDEMGKMWKAALAYNEKVMNNLGTKKYDDLMKDIKAGECFLIGGSGNTFDSIKLNLIKDAKGVVTEIQIHFPFIDNRYYDKEKLILKIKKNDKGVFTIKEKFPYADLPASVNMYELNIIPFEGRLLFNFPYAGNSGNNIKFAITTDLTDQMVTNILGCNAYFNDKLYYGISMFSVPTQYESSPTPYMKWYMLQNLETEYSIIKDPIIFANFYNQRYVPALLSK